MDNSVDIVNFISESLDTGKYREALNAPNEDKFKEKFRDNCWDLISNVVEKIQNDTLIIKPSLYGACEQMLALIIEKCSPEEALLEFIERIELATCDAQFSIILPCLLQLLKKLTAKRERSLEWCFNSISTYIETIPITEHFLENDERKLMDSDPNIQRVVKVYSILPTFYKPFIDELSEGNIPNIMTKQIITAFLISLLGSPMIHIDIDANTNARSEARQVCETIIQDICRLEKDVFKFLKYLSICSKEKPKSINSENEESYTPYEHREKINMTTLAGFFYCCYSGNFILPDMAIPQIYSIEYVVNTMMLAVNHLLSFTQFGPLSKAISLFQALNSRLGKQTSHQLLLGPEHYDLFKGFVKVAIFCNYQSLRKAAVSCIGEHIIKFDYKGRCALIKYLIEASNHSGMIGFAITQYKNALTEAFNEPVMHECFSGVQLSSIIRKICYLPHGAESDLMEHADQIITTLNFLRFLILKDSDNVTGIRDMFPKIESEYLTTLRTAVKMSKAHYELNLKELKEGKQIPNENRVTLNIGGNVLDSIPAEKKQEIVESALNGFHLIECLVARVTDIITLRASRRFFAPSTYVPLRSQLLARNYCKTVNEPDLKVPAVVSPSEHEEQQYEENIKSQILEKALEFVPKSGWSVESLSSGAKAAGYPTITHGLFPNGGGDLVHYFNIKCNEQLIEIMKAWPKEDLKDGKTPTKFVENAIFTRLLMIEPYKSTWPKAMAIQSLPTNVPNCLATLLSLVDDICYYSGDRSVDFNWYVRRVGLAGIYKASELFYLTDNSQDNDATRNFVASRIRDAQFVQMALNLNPVTAAPQSWSAAFVTAKNILGINPLK